MATDWALPSGTWTRNAETGAFSLLVSSLGNAPSPLLSEGDISHALVASVSDSSRGAVFPPEFNFDPDTGLSLNRITDASDPLWIGPYGASRAKAGTRAVRGLRQSSILLSLRRQRARRVEDDSDRKLKLPPAGRYEFFSIPAGTVASSLLAIDPSKGHVYVWLDQGARWEAMEHIDGGMLAETRIDRVDWRAEAAVDALTARVFLSTDDGLACLVPDAVGLSFKVSYHGGSPALASPVQFGDHIWAPLGTAKGAITFVGLDLEGASSTQVELRDDALDSLGRIAAPVTNASDIIWVTERGQLLLQRKASGVLEGSFEPWPEFIEPALRFGSPYLSSDGLLWQLCIDERSGTFVYAKLGRGNWETRDAQPPRLSSGNFNFRFSTKYRTAPWIEPEHGDDSASDSVVMPVIESVENFTVFGIKFKSTKGIESLLSQSERTRVVLIVDDANTQTEFGTLTVPDPLELRLFVHDAHLWAYHPDHTRLEGWALGS